MFIRSKRLFLRPAWEDDRSELEALLPNAGTGATFLFRVGDPADRFCPNFLMTLPGQQGATIVGGVALVRNGDDLDLICLIAPAHRGQGFEAEAVKAVLPLACLLGHRHVRVAFNDDGSPPARSVDLGGDCHEPGMPRLAA